MQNTIRDFRKSVSAVIERFRKSFIIYHKHKKPSVGEKKNRKNTCPNVHPYIKNVGGSAVCFQTHRIL